ncbi:uncharacterized protein LOC142237776 [Haematobia irritans]|uniref:uncharacterized protein LOC142237776 n=1 Tax=Haematobia irritans TaxID=7368 RepID=UPI003F5014F9
MTIHFCHKLDKTMGCVANISIFIVFTLLFFNQNVFAKKKKPCIDNCPEDGIPVCGTFYVGYRIGFVTCNFVNSCKLRFRECIANERWLDRDGHCKKDTPHCDVIRSERPDLLTTTKPPSKFTKCKRKVKKIIKDVYTRPKREDVEECVVEE